MNNVNIATAWHRLAKVVQKILLRSTGGQQAYKLIVNEDIRMGYSERLTKKFANSFDAMNLSNIVWSCAVLNYSHAGYILSCAHKNIRERAHAGLRLPSYPVSDMKTFPSAQALSNCLWSLTTLRHPCAKKFAELVAQVMPKLIHQFDPSAASIGGAFVTQTVTNQLWSFATLRSHPAKIYWIRLLTCWLKTVNTSNLRNYRMRCGRTLYLRIIQEMNLCTRYAIHRVLILSCILLLISFIVCGNRLKQKCPDELDFSHCNTWQTPYLV